MFYRKMTSYEDFITWPISQQIRRLKLLFFIYFVSGILSCMLCHYLLFDFI